MGLVVSFFFIYGSLQHRFNKKSSVHIFFDIGSVFNLNKISNFHRNNVIFIEFSQTQSEHGDVSHNGCRHIAQGKPLFISFWILSKVCHVVGASLRLLLSLLWMLPLNRWTEIETGLAILEDADAFPNASLTCISIMLHFFFAMGEFDFAYCMVFVFVQSIVGLIERLLMDCIMMRWCVQYVTRILFIEKYFYSTS